VRTPPTAWRNAPEPERKRPTLVEATGQAWKLSAFHYAMVAVGIASAVQFLGPREWMLPAFLTVLALGAASLAVLVAVRCPSCRRSLGLWAMTTQTPTRFMVALETVEACPRCGFGE
jgi:hypothetical protein